MPAPNWLTWHRDVFERARIERKPVLLSISASWCQACREMDATSYADPDVVRVLAERFLAIRVDADRRPDISDRYTLGGWPTTAFLTAEGDLVSGGTYIPVERMRNVLEQVASAVPARTDGLRERPAAGGLDHPHPAPDDSDDALTRIVLSQYDPAHGGFGTAPKYPLAAPLRLALHLYRAGGGERVAEIATRSLDAIGWGGLHDPMDGGFFHYAEHEDWTGPHTEKLLEINAALIDLWIDAAETFGDTRYAGRARDTVQYVQNWLADQGAGAWGGSQQADPEYYTSRAAGDRRSAPGVDRTLYARANGMMVSAALRAGRALRDESLGQFAIASLERILLTCYRPGAGVAHWFDEAAHVRGLLGDQVAVAAACLDAYDATGNIVYEMMAEELARYAMRVMWDEARGGFFDRSLPDEAECVGLMAQRLRPFVENCDAAVLLHRLAASSGENDFAERARATLAAASAGARDQGPQAAHHVLARVATRLR